MVPQIFPPIELCGTFTSLISKMRILTGMRGLPFYLLFIAFSIYFEIVDPIMR